MTVKVDNSLKVLHLPGQHPDVRTLVSGLQRRDPETAEAFYDRYQDRIHGLVWRLLGADDEHDDMVQQVLAQVLASIDGLRDPDLLEPWLIGLTVNTVRKEIRKRRMRRILHLTPGNLEVASNELRPERQQLAIRVYEILDRMGIEDRIVFILRYIEGHSLATCAIACGCSLAAVKRRLNKAKRAFSKIAEKDLVLASWMEGETDE